MTSGRALLLLAACAPLLSSGCRSSWEERVESVQVLRGVRVEGQKLAEFLEPRMLLLMASTGPEDDEPSTKGCAAVVTTDGYALTAAHVVGDRASVRASTTVGEGAGEAVHARVVWRSDDPDALDLALLHVEGLRLPAAFNLARLDVAAVGTRVVMGGYPGGALRIAISGGAVTRVLETTFEHSAPGQQGDSGGPVIDAVGRLVGVASGGYWSPFGGWEGIATIPDPAWLARTIAADRARRAAHGSQ